MRRYFETLFRHKRLFLIPAIMVPIIALIATLAGGKQYTVEGSLWVEPVAFLQPATERAPQAPANVVEAQSMSERLGTESFRRAMMDKTGLTRAIEQGQWPAPTGAQQQMESLGLTRIPGLRSLLDMMGLVPPATRNDAINGAMVMIKDTMAVTPVGNNLVKVTYNGQEPLVGKRLIEEAITLFREKAQTQRTEEARNAIDFYTRQLALQQERVSQASLAVQQYLESHPEPIGNRTRPPAEQRELDSFRRTLAQEQGIYDSTLRTLEQVRLTGEASVSSINKTLDVVDAPQAPSGAPLVGRYISMVLLLGLILGVLCGLLPVLVMTWMDNKVRTREDIQQIIQAPVIVQVPVIPQYTSQGPDAARVAMARRAFHGGHA